MSFAAAQYRAATVETASPVQIVVRLYDGALQSLHQAVQAVEHKDLRAKVRHLRRAHAIVSELQASLAHNHANDLCVDLDRLYDYVLHCITTGSSNNPTDELEGAARVLRELRNAWAELATKNG